MNKRIRNLAPSLVGGSIDFSFNKKVDGATPISKNIEAAKRNITKNVERALSVGGSAAVMLLAELSARYQKEIYYMAVRPCIEMRRYRPQVIEWLEQSVNERADRLYEALSCKRDTESVREAKVEALRYFLTTYKGRLSLYKEVLTKEEFLIVV